MISYKTYMQPTEKLLFSNKSLWNLIWPLITERFLDITVGIADIIMVASLGESAVSGVSLVNTLYILIQTLLTALATGGAVVCSQYIGLKRTDMASKTAIQLLYTIIFGSILTMMLGLVSNRIILQILFGNVDMAVMENARVYFMYMLLGLPSIAVYNACAALFRSQGNSRVSMFTSILVNIINISGNAIMLYGLHRGVEGVAISTLIARTLAAGILFALLFKKQKNIQNENNIEKINTISIRDIGKVPLEGYLIKKILHIGIPTGLESSVFHVGKVLVITLIASFGTTAIAANAAANTIASFQILPASAIGLALLTVVGQCMGAGRIDQAVHYTKKLMFLTYISMAIINIPLLLLSKQLIGLFVLSEATTQLGWQMIVSSGVLSLLFWPTSFGLPNALRAANDAKYTMIVSFISMWTVRIGMSYLFAVSFGLGAIGVWIAMYIDWICRSIAFIIRFRRGKWGKERLV